MSAVQTSAIKAREARQAARQRARARQKRIRAAIFGVIVVGVLVAAGSLLYSAFSRPKLAALAGNVIDIAADMSGFDTKLIRVKVGEPVTIRLTSLDNSHHTDGGGKHQWAVDELGANVIAQPESSNTVTFTPEAPGTYTYYCDICCGGRANPTMQGTLVVDG
jgi:heme/copper-type cytochrome/quinol oxidase subunit 2